MQKINMKNLSSFTFMCYTNQNFDDEMIVVVVVIERDDEIDGYVTYNIVRRLNAARRKIFLEAKSIFETFESAQRERERERVEIFIQIFIYRVNIYRFIHSINQI